MINIKNLTYEYSKGVKAVDDLTLDINVGDIYGFVGHNGAGKSTTIKALVGINAIMDGDIIINGKSIKDKPIECKKEMAYIPDNPDLYEGLTGIQYLNFICDIFDVKGNRLSKIESYADMFEIKSSLANQIKTYSHGMKQKLAIIGALVHEPKILVMDEPFVGLDTKASRIVKDILRDIAAKGGCVFFSSHVLETVEQICNKVAIIKSGRLQANGDIASLKGDESLEDLFLELLEKKDDQNE